MLNKLCSLDKNEPGHFSEKDSEKRVVQNESELKILHEFKKISTEILDETMKINNELQKDQ